MKLPLTAPARRIALTLAGAAVLTGAAGVFHAQAAGGAVIYRSCIHPATFVWGRFPECGIDDEATQQLQEVIEDTTRPLTPQDQERVDQHIDQQFAAPVLAGRQAELLVLIDWTVRRIETVLGSGAYQFAAGDRVTLQQAKATLQQLTADAQDRSLSRGELDGLATQVRAMVTDVSHIVAAAPKAVPAGTPTIENLVTRIDALVARVGTVIRDLERAGLAVPRVVRDGHAHALQLVRESKRSCSTRRPAACANLAEVLDVIAAMRGPLCGLQSELLEGICQ